MLTECAGNGCCFCVTLPRAKGELAACHHPLCSVVDLFIYLFFLWGTGPLGSLFVWAVCSRSLKSWQKSFTVNRMHVFCHASTQITFVHLLFLSWWDVAARWKFFARSRSGPDACGCVPKPSREHVKKSCGMRMLLLPVGLRELHTERRDKLIQWKSRLRASRVNISRDIC